MARPHLFLDLSRLLWRAGRFAPSGIDRVELAYAKHLIATERDRLSFAGWWGRLGLLPEDPALAFIAALDALWSGATVERALRRRTTMLARRLRLHALLRGERGLHASARAHANSVYLLVSHHRLDRPSALFRLKRRTGARFLCFVHDLIPIEYPEYVPFGHPRRHRRRMRTLAGLADGLIVNSAGTRAAFERRRGAARREAPILIAPLGIDLPMPAIRSPAATSRPYFVCVATIEPRKNHLLLLAVWQRLAAEYGGRAPRLILIGRRGWRSRKILAPLSRSDALSRLVEEHNTLPDGAVAQLVAGALAALLPSFAEGFGLPLAEALSLGVPVLCSDLPELREIGGAVPEYLDPLDVAQWRAAVIDYTKPDSLRRERQLDRLEAWRKPSWRRHFAQVRRLIDDDRR